MLTRTSTLLLIVAAAASVYAAITFLAGMDTDSQVALLAAVLSIGGMFALDHRASERRWRDR